MSVHREGTVTFVVVLFSCFMCQTQRTVRSPIHDMLSGIALIISHMQSPTLCMMTVRVQNEPYMKRI